VHLTITAQRDGTTDTDGMTLGELERALQRIRLNGGQDDTPLDVLANRSHRVRSVTADVDENTSPVTAADERALIARANAAGHTVLEATRPAARAVVDAPQA